MVFNGFDQQLSLQISADPAHLATARAFAGSIARVLGLNDAFRQDLRLAVSELITVAIVGGASDLTIAADFAGPTAAFRIAALDPLPAVPLETSALLAKLMGATAWSDREPWVIRLIDPEIND